MHNQENSKTTELAPIIAIYLIACILVSPIFEDLIKSIQKEIEDKKNAK